MWGQDNRPSRLWESVSGGGKQRILTVRPNKHLDKANAPNMYSSQWSTCLLTTLEDTAILNLSCSTMRLHVIQLLSIVSHIQAYDMPRSRCALYPLRHVSMEGLRLGNGWRP